jgi:hypothetical protein
MSKSVGDSILALSDSDAERVLITVARARAGSMELVDTTVELRGSLAAEFGPMAGCLVSRGDLARQALLVLAEDRASRQAIETTAEHLSELPQSFDGGASFALTAAVLFVLQMEVDFQRGKDGKWNFKLKKKAASDAVVKQLAEKLVSFWGKKGI